MLNAGKTLWWLALGLTLLPNRSTAEETVPIPWLEANLAPNPDFEEVTDDGRTPKDWTAPVAPDRGLTVETDPTVFLKGRRALRIAVPQSDTQVVASSPLMPVEGNALYLVSLAFRQEGFNASGQPDHFEGVSSYPRVQWLDENQKGVGHSTILSRFPYSPSRWDLRDAFERTPANARWARIDVTVTNNSLQESGQTIPATLWIDAVQLRQYRPPPTPDWAKGEAVRVVEGAAPDTRVLAYFVGGDDTFHSRGGTWSRIVTDPEAERGVALAARAPVEPGIMAHSPYYPALPAGLYRVCARVKVPSTNNNTPVGYMDVDSQSAGTRLILSFAPSAETPGKYAEVEGDFILRDAGWWDLRLFTHGKEAWSVDSLKVFPLHELEDRQLLAIYPGSEGEIPADLQPAPFQPVLGGPRQPLRGLAVVGFGYDRFRIADVFHSLHRDAEMTAVWVKTSNGVTTFSGFPEDPRDFFQYSILFLCNVNVRGMALKYKNALREYVKRGGALVVMGGHQGYERGGWRGSLIEEALPVEAAPTLRRGLICRPRGQPLQVNPQVPWLEAISTASSPLTYHLHAATVKPTGEVLVQAGDQPFLVAGAYSEGRVVCLLGLPWGDPGPHETPFWEWDDWVDLLREVCWWAMKSPVDLSVENPEE
jgi:hypothetical protein